jgi:hypothetical protein
LIENLKTIDKWKNDNESLIRHIFKDYKITIVTSLNSKNSDSETYEPSHFCLQKKTRNGIYKKTGEPWFEYGEKEYLKITLQNKYNFYLYNTYKHFKGYILWVTNDGWLTLIDTRKIEKRFEYYEDELWGKSSRIIEDNKDKFSNKYFTKNELKERGMVVWSSHIESFKYNELSENKKYFHKYKLKPFTSHPENRYYKLGSVFELILNDDRTINCRKYLDTNHYFRNLGIENDRKEWSKVRMSLVRNGEFFNKMYREDNKLKCRKNRTNKFVFCSNDTNIVNYLNSIVNENYFKNQLHLIFNTDKVIIPKIDYEKLESEEWEKITGNKKEFDCLKNEVVNENNINKNSQNNDIQSLTINNQEINLDKEYKKYLEWCEPLSEDSRWNFEEWLEIKYGRKIKC